MTFPSAYTSYLPSAFGWRSLAASSTFGLGVAHPALHSVTPVPSQPKKFARYRWEYCTNTPSTTPEGFCSSSSRSAMDFKNASQRATSTVPVNCVQYLMRLVRVSQAPSVLRFHSRTMRGMKIALRSLAASMASRISEDTGKRNARCSKREAKTIEKEEAWKRAWKLGMKWKRERQGSKIAECTSG